MVLNNRHTLGDNHGGKGGATTESLHSNTRNAIENSVKLYDFRDIDITLVTTTLIDNFCSQCLLVEAVVDAFNDFF